MAAGDGILQTFSQLLYERKGETNIPPKKKPDTAHPYALRLCSCKTGTVSFFRHSRTGFSKRGRISWGRGGEEFFLQVFQNCVSHELPVGVTQGLISPVIPVKSTLFILRLRTYFVINGVSLSTEPEILFRIISPIIEPA